MKTHKDLDAWKNSMELCKEIYWVTANFPSEEKFGLITQMRRAAVSIPSNIAEGAARNHKKEFIQFLYMAIGSLSELETQIIISQELDYLKPEQTDILNQKMMIINKRLQGLIHHLKEKE